jgi:RNA polymerase sigma-70 factor (ECF subfamily)
MEHSTSLSKRAERARAPLGEERPGRAGAIGNEGFETLFREHRASLLSFLYRRLWSREDAEDALMQTFYKAWRARDAFRGEVSRKQWLYAIAGHVSIDMLRSRRRVEALTQEEAGEVELAPPYDPMDAVLRSECRAEIREAVERLAPEQRQLIQLYYFDEYRYEEISSVLGISRTQVRGRLHRIRRLIERDLVSRAPSTSAARS